MVVDDHPVVRAGIVGLLESEADIEVVAEAESGERALELLAGLRAEASEGLSILAEDHAPHVVLVDLRMPGMGGVEATRRIVDGVADGGRADSRADSHADALTDPLTAAPSPTPKVLVFTTYEQDDQILAAIEAGASGYLLKAAPASELLAGVRAVVSGQTVLAPSIAAGLAKAVRGQRGQNRDATLSGAQDLPQLTPRESEILALVADGLSNPAIAARLYIGESTVKTHLLHVFEKLEVNDRTRAVTKAMQLGLLG
ncbi:MAG: response regulator transcription factor [Leucobacter sp.]|nr:response regulator transcription factor [Leucobacter sp.]